jgi:hypothetical protein
LAPDGTPELSVFRTDTLTAERIWEIADEVAANATSPPVMRARAALRVGAITALGLVVCIDEPPLHHAVIRNLPSEKHEMLLVEQQLAELATLVLRSREVDGWAPP